MTNTESSPDDERPRVLHVTTDEAVRELVVRQFADEQPSLDVVPVTAETAADHLDDVDCVLSDHALPETDGLALLRAVRTARPELPFVLYTAAGNEAVASEAISAGVTDYVQQSDDCEHVALLAQRVWNLATRYRTTRTVDDQERRFRKLVEHSSDVVSIVDANGVFQYVSPASRHVFGYDPEELVGEVGFQYLHPEDVEYVAETLARAIADPTARPVITFRFDHPEKGWIVLENTGRNLIDDPDIAGFVINSHDVTRRVERAAQLERQRDRLAEFASVVSHDLRNPLTVASGNLSLIEATEDVSHAADVRLALERMEAIIDDLLTLAREGEDLTDLSAVPLAQVAEAAWQSVDTKAARLAVETDTVVMADAGRLRQLLENLFSNAVAHAGPTAFVHVVDVPDGCGFAISDDGPGIDDDDLDEIFDYGVSSSPTRTGFGLAIVKRIADAHGWTITVTHGADGGARFEFRDIERPGDASEPTSNDSDSGENAVVADDAVTTD
jgi:PAS domain S-box-containing protein